MGTEERSNEGWEVVIREGLGKAVKEVIRNIYSREGT